MRRFFPLLLATASACSTFRAPPSSPRAVSTLALLDEPKGVCAISVGDGSTEGWSRTTGKASASLGQGPLPRWVQACARSRRGSQAESSGGILELEFVFESEDDRWRPEYWHLEVIRQSGLVIYAGTLDPGTSEEGVCLVPVCNMRARTTVELAAPWGVDEYRLRLRHVPTGQRIELSITLEE